jgi:outer membrane protein assembly factor BamB
MKQVRPTRGLVVLALVAGCAGSNSFSIAAQDNRPERLRAALAQAVAPAPGSPRNRLGKHLIYAVAAVKGKTTVLAYDLDSATELWRVTSAVNSRLVAAREVVAFVGERALVGHDVASGVARWNHRVERGEITGIAADDQRVYYVVQDKRASRAAERWRLVALDARSGRTLWQAPAPGQIGTPAARGGLVFSPLLKQWLVILDGKTGKQLARLRGLDREISFVRDSPEDVYFGSSRGIVRLDLRAASGRSDQSTFAAVDVPQALNRAHYHWDAFDPIQTSYSAYDRNRLLWRAEAGDGPLTFIAKRVVVHAFRFFFGFDPSTGQLAWVYGHPRVDAIASCHLGKVIALASAAGEIGGIDVATGARRFQGRVDLAGGTLRGATCDAEGWAPASNGGEVDVAATLMAIVRDRDARFLDIKLYALDVLERMSDSAVTGHLLALLRGKKTARKVHDKIVEVLVGRADRAGLEPLVKELEVEHSFLTGEAPLAVGVLARAIAAMGDINTSQDVDPALKKRLLDALVIQLQSPQATPDQQAAIVRALSATGLADIVRPLRHFLLLYRADPEFARHGTVIAATIDALLHRGGIAERELVAFVAEDGRTRPQVADQARIALRARRESEPLAAPPGQSASTPD